MRDLISSIFLIAGTYVCSAGFAIVLFRMFFPLKTKYRESNNLTFETGGNRWRPSTRTKVHLLAVSGRKGLVKASS
jgi:hypothetical protein